MLTRRTLVAALVAAPLAACTRTSPTAHPLRVIGNRLFVDALVNGHPVEALLDSGAEMSLADRAAADMLGLAGGQSVTARGSGAGTTQAAIVEGVAIEAAGVRLIDRSVAVIDLADVGRRLIGRPLPFIVGRDLFDAARLFIDIEGGVLRAVDRAVTPPGVQLPLQTAHGIETMPVAVEGEPAWAEFDLGNGSEVSVSRTYARKLGLDAPERLTGRKSGGGIGGAVERDTTTLRTLTVAGVTFHDVPATIDDNANAGDVNVGVSILRRFHITTDYAQHAIWLSPRR